MSEAVMDDDGALQCASRSKIGNIGDFNDLVIPNWARSGDVLLKMGHHEILSIGCR